MTITAPTDADTSVAPADIIAASQRSAADVLGGLGINDQHGLSGAEVTKRQAQWGPNAVSSHQARFWPVLWHQLRSPLLVLLLSAALASYFVGREERRGDHRRDRRPVGRARVRQRVPGREGRRSAARPDPPRDRGHPRRAARARSTSPIWFPATWCELRLGDIVPADLRLIAVTGLELRRVGADRRVAAGRQGHRRRRRRDGVGRADRLRADGHRRERRQRPRRGRLDRRPDRVRQDRRRAVHPPARHRVPGRACGSSRCCWSTSPAR